MEIISYVLEGALEHQDSLGNGSVIRPGEIQLMSAGTGVMHSEYNPSGEDLVHFLQIWIVPDQTGLTPCYQQRHFSLEAQSNELLPVVSPDGQSGALRIHQDAEVYAAILDLGRSVAHCLGAGRRAWVQVARGRINLNGIYLQAGDGAAFSDETRIEMVADGEAEILLFDLA
jgi:hypothetical protein